MKPKLLFALAILLIFASCEYNPGVSEAFTKYRFKEGVTTITIPGWVIGLAAQFADVDDNEREMLDCIDKVRILSVENDELNARINLHQEFNEKINRNHEFEELLAVHDDKEQVTIFGRMDGNVISEMVVLVGGDENVMIYVRGEIDPKLINNGINLADTEKLLSFKF